MPNRLLKESICTSETLASLSAEEERMFYRLIVVADDFGRMDARLAVLRAQCFPMMLSKVSEADIDTWLDRLEEAGLLTRYEVEGKPYVHVATWDKHQHRRAKYSKYPPPPSSTGACEHVRADASTCCRDTNSRHENRETRHGSRDARDATTATTTTERAEVIEDLRPAIRFFENNVHPGISPTEIDSLSDYQQQGMAVDVLIEAMKRAVEAGPDKTNMAYIKGILNRWAGARVRTVQDVERLDHLRQKARDAPETLPAEETVPVNQENSRRLTELVQGLAKKLEVPA